MFHVGKLKKSIFWQPYLNELMIIIRRIVINSNRQCTFSRNYFQICCYNCTKFNINWSSTSKVIEGG